MEDHVHWKTTMGARDLINDGWYKTSGRATLVIFSWCCWFARGTKPVLE